MKMKKILSLILAGCMVASIFTACGNNATTESSESKTQTTSEAEKTTESATEPVVEGFQHDPVLNELGAETICKEKITLTIGVKADANTVSFDDNYYTKLIEEKANVDLEFIEYAGGDAQEKLRIQIAGGEKLPDIIMWNMDEAEAMDLGAQEYFVPLEEYFENSSAYAVEAFKQFEELNVDVLGLSTSSDGHIWQFPKMVDSLTNPTPLKLWVYGPWLEAVGMTEDDVRDVDGFTEMLRRFKNNDPNGNGKADEIPLLGYTNTDGTIPGNSIWNYIMNAFVYTNAYGTKDFLIDKNGTLDVSFVQDEFKEGVKYINQLVEEGLYDPVSFTQDMNTMRAVLNTAGDQLVGGFTHTSPTLMDSKHPAFENWVLLEPLIGPEGYCSTTYNADLPGGAATITTDCEHPEVAFRVLDLMCEEEISIVSRYGEEGVNWAYIEDVKSEYPEADWNVTYGGYTPFMMEIESVWGKEQDKHWGDIAPAVRTGKVSGGIEAGSIATGVAAARIYELSEHFEAYRNAIPEEAVVRYSYANADDQQEGAELYREISSYVAEMLDKWFVGESDVESDWNEYLETLEELGLSDWLALVQKNYK